MFRHRKVRALAAFCAAIFAAVIAFAWTEPESGRSGGLPSGSIQSKVQTACTECHDAGIILQQRLSKKAWTKEVDKMIKWGAVVDPKDRDAFIDYLGLNFPPEKPAEPMPRVSASKYQCELSSARIQANLRNGGGLRVLVTGGAGYIGSHTAHALKRRGHEVVVYDNLSTGHAALAQGFDLIEGDICDTAKLAPILRWVDAVMHFAAYAYVGESVVNPRKYFQNNVTGGLSVLNAVVDSNVRKFIFSSTCAVYGVPVKVPITEENPRLPVNPYGVSKLMLEQALEAYEHAYGFRFVCFRYFNAAGADEEGRAGEEHDPETHLIPSVFEAVP